MARGHTTMPRSPGPVFVVGASRSGTALLRSIINESSEVHLAGETHYFDDLRARLGDMATTGPLDGKARQLCEDYFLALGHRPYGHGGRPRDSRLDRDELRQRATTLGGTGDAYFQAFCEMNHQLEGTTQKPRWGEKTPRHVFRLPEILASLPDARVVVMVRDPRAVAASYGNWTNRGGFDEYAERREAVEAEEARAAASYDPSISALLWRAGVRAALAAGEHFGHDRVRIQRYEDLVLDQDRQLQELGRFLEIEVGPEMLDVPMHNSSFSSFDRSGGISTTPLERWRTTLDPRDVATIQFWSGRVMQELGYELQEARLSLLDRGRIMATGVRAAVRAVVANRHRAGSLPGYVLRRIRLAFSR